MYFLYNLLQKDSDAGKLTYISTAKVIKSERLKLYLDINVARELIMYLNFLWTRPVQPVVAGDMLLVKHSYVACGDICNGKMTFNPFPDKVDTACRSNFKTCELFIHGDIYYVTNFTFM